MVKNSGHYIFNWIKVSLNLRFAASFIDLYIYTYICVCVHIRVHIYIWAGKLLMGLMI